MQLVTMMGWMYLGVILAVILYIIGQYRNDKRMCNAGILLFITLIITAGCIEIIKLIIARPRPYTEIASLIVLNHESNLSFPSGHTATATVIAYCLSREYKHTALFMLIPLVVGISRLYLGVHYPSDVICGFIFALIISYVCYHILLRYKIISK
ncbi:phosphatase PAP2 family protein [uncultured Methanosphaera sp.]|uniref:phosphatase PAP2 family protein n=1 Tax=uncultured Methanosphaera sp. TaxID=262501 RepID=UPI0028060C05|nr:phosphatase PAP2 family protein [uncultured Methanosphaera sp.]